MTDADPEILPRQRPRQVTWAAVVLVIFGSISLMRAMLLLSIINDEPDLPRWIYGLVTVQFLLAGAQTLSGIFVWLGKSWARTVATVVCSVNLVGAVFALAGDIVQAITTAAVNIGLLWLLRRPEVGDWCRER